MNPNKALWEKGDFTCIAESTRESGEALVKELGITNGLRVRRTRQQDLQSELEALFNDQNASSSKDDTSIPATFLRVTVAL